MSAPEQTAPKVFISYSHDSAEHAARVLALADSLEEYGIEVLFDQYDPHPDDGWPLWMEKNVDAADFVLLICTETYRRRVRGEAEPGKGLGARWEGKLLYNGIYSDEPQGSRFIPILLEGGDPAHIPGPVQGHTRYRLQNFDLSDPGYQALYRHLTGQPTTPRPRRGALKVLSPRPRRAPNPLSFWNVPARNPLFTGRDDVLDALHKHLTRDGRVALSGLGGMGKTQTAIEYAHRHRDEYRAHFWVRAETRDEIASGLAALARLLDLPERDEADRSVVVDAVRGWLENNTGWLLVLDNADEPALLPDFLPSGEGGHLLLTTRAPDTAGIAPRVRLRAMEAEAGARLLLRRAGLLEGDAEREIADEAARAAALALCHEMDGLPLALDQAGAYIAATASSPAEYLSLYRKHGASLRAERGEGGLHAHPSVAVTFSLAFRKVARPARAHPFGSRAAVDLLRLCAFLAPDAIPEEILTQGAPDLGRYLRPAVANPLTYHKAVQEARRYSLLERDASTRTLWMHRLVQEVLKDGMTGAARRGYAERAARAVNRAFPEPEFSNWADCERLLPHARACANTTAEMGMASPVVGRLLNQAGHYLLHRAQYAEAEPLFRRSLAIRERALGTGHPETATTLNNLAELYKAQGRYAEAEPLYQRSLAMRERVLGKEHPHVAISLNNLAGLYYAQGNLLGVEPLLQRSLAMRERALGTEHPGVAASLNNLAELYRAQGRFTEAEPLLQRSLAIRERALGTEHPDVAQSLNNLAELYRDQGKFTEAEPLYQQSLAIYEQALGPEHPEVATSLNNLAALYYQQGEFAQAESLLQRSLAMRQRALGTEHPSVAQSLNNLAELYLTLGKFAEAEPLYQRALAVFERALGTEHPDVAQSINNLAGLYYAQGKLSEAEPLYQRALALFERLLGAEHPSVAQSLSNLAELHRAQGNLAEAEPLFQRALAIAEQTLGKEHPLVATGLNNLAHLYRERGQLAEAEPLYRRSLAIREGTLGKAHPEVAESLNNLAWLCYDRNNLTEAESLLPRALAIFEQALGPDHPNVATVLENYAALLSETGRTAEAAVMRERAEAIRNG